MIRGELKPIAAGMQAMVSAPPEDRAFAKVGRRVQVLMAHAMPDCQSAILSCLVWQATRQERLLHGRHAQEFVARISGRQLMRMTGRPLRTVKHALMSLRKKGLIQSLPTGPGQTVAYVPQLGKRENPTPESPTPRDQFDHGNADPTTDHASERES